MTDYKKIAKETAKVYFLTLLIIPLSFFVRMIYARNLTLVDYGLFYGLFAFFGFFGFLRDWGLTSATNYFANKYIVHNNKSKVKALLFINWGFRLFMSIVIGLVSYESVLAMLFHFNLSINQLKNHVNIKKHTNINIIPMFILLLLLYIVVVLIFRFQSLVRTLSQLL